MNKFRKFLIKLVKPKDYEFIVIDNRRVHDDEMHGREYIQMDESLRLYFEDSKYVGFSTQLPNTAVQPFMDCPLGDSEQEG